MIYLLIGATVLVGPPAVSCANISSRLPWEETVAITFTSDCQLYQNLIYVNSSYNKQL